MARKIRLAAAQMGATHRDSPRHETLGRMLRLLDQAAARKAEVLLFPEIAFTTFFPRHLLEHDTELDAFFEHGDISTAASTASLFNRARELAIDISVGFAETTHQGERFNTCIYYHAKTGSTLSKYRKIHLPGDFEPFSDPEAVNQLEKRYFRPGNLGFEAFRVPALADDSEPIFGMMICNDRRWPEAWRCLGLQGVEVVLCGYNTAGFAPHLWGADQDQDPQAAEADALFHHRLTMQSNSYMNATFSVCAARCGLDDGRYNLIGGSCIVDPEGKILVEAETKDDELIAADCDLDRCTPGKTRTFDFARHRRPEHYDRIVKQTGVVEPPRISGARRPSQMTTERRRRSTKPIIAIPSKPITSGGAKSVREIDEPDADDDGDNDNDDTPTIRNTSTARQDPSLPTPPSHPTTTTPSPNKPIRILLLNPNSTASMTQSCLASLLPSLPPDVDLIPFTGPAQSSPTAIESQTDAILSAAACLRALLHPPTPLPFALASLSAVLVACFSAHPLIPALRESLPAPLPVVGIMEAALLHARTLAPRFGILATSPRALALHALALDAYAMAAACAGVEALDLGVLDLERLPRQEVLGRMRAAADALIARGAEVLCLGCAGMAGLRTALEEAVEGRGVQVVDGVVAGVQHLVGVVRAGGRTSRVGMYRSAEAGRKRRGQTYF